LSVNLPDSTVTTSGLGRHDDAQAATIRQLVGLAGWFGFGNFQVDEALQH
jgi:hypothetical protein